ncbi:hypothetical protein [Hymenobacter arizonensis]|uniref:Uncharacterized protein n=1 Tax=Hymenobacter arizonensis TaxID=1227077 RepID=A0A1I6B6A4_HYMAR|nr:hypothetical protein [Hymenobacter arizonensis]SFQ76470.1 hypothetical protein SAMN04515668_4214 [Hymenobacter arizonensis]
MSQTPEMPEKGGRNLRRALNNLPAHEPEPATWARIEAQLAVDVALAQAIPALPTYEPDDDLWANVAARLDAAAATEVPAAAPAPLAVERQLWPARSMRRMLAIAASVLLVLGVWWQVRPAASVPTVARETVTFSEEESLLSLPAPPADPLERQGLSFIDAHCSSQPVVCQSGEFRTLRMQLEELETQEAQLHQDARRFGASPELLREQARLVTLKATVTRELVQLLIS